MKGPFPFQGEIITKKRKLQIFFSRTTEPISTKLGTKYPWVKGIHVCSNEWPLPFPRGDNYEIAKINWRNLKIFFSRTTGPISTKLGTTHSLLNGIWFYSKKNNLILIKIVMFFFSLNQRYDIIICVYWFEFFLMWVMWPMGLLLWSDNN